MPFLRATSEDQTEVPKTPPNIGEKDVGDLSIEELLNIKITTASRKEEALPDFLVSQPLTLELYDQRHALTQTQCSYHP
jgi:hypothetical protein